MNSFCFVSIILVFTISHVYETAFANDETIFEDALLFPKGKNQPSKSRWKLSVPENQPNLNIAENENIPSLNNDDKDSSTDSDFSKEFDFNKTQPLSTSSELDSGKSPDLELPKEHSSNSELLKDNSSSVENNGSPLRSRSSTVATWTAKVINPKRTVIINEDTDRLKLDEGDSGGSNLWIYLNLICILLVIAVCIFIIYYPKKDGLCKTLSQSSCESSTSSSTSSEA